MENKVDRWGCFRENFLMLTGKVNREKMFYLDRWAKGKDLGLVMMAQQLAIGADKCCEFLRMIKGGGSFEAISSIQKGKEWVRLYRNHRQMVRSLIEGLRRFRKTGHLLADMAELIFLRRKTLKETLKSLKRQFKKMPPFEWRRFISEVQKELNRFYYLHRADIESDITEKNDEGLNGKLKEALNEREINFYFKVWIPCWLLYRDYPPRLLRGARLGDVGAMEKLLRLDSRVFDDTKIKKFFHQTKEKGNEFTLNRLTDALKKRPKPRITLKKVKYSIAGLISAISEIMGNRLSEAEIAGLFHAIACDRGREDGDADIPDRDRIYAFAKAIYRERAFWMPILQPDKK